ncbi:DUF3566 domain-containing protein [Actinotalea ferrariae]|uniref:DUF3566 domain-containing protein n=1 Tax=Actinotalea ferrariae TaxID=1386098 RepID=UPI001C8B2FC6|nr:DUF3566 domain-containing protein [Actinotalea ferrariae]MBX9243451.1 DUF3566 domain-containing protein [Actinotalea ferrariae]
MSTEGTPPPSIAPKRPIANPTSQGGGGTAVRSAEAPPRPAPSGSGETGSTAPAAQGGSPSGAASAGTTSSAPSFAERLKQSAQGAVDAARTALPTKDEDTAVAAKPVRQPTAARTSARPATSTTTSSAAPSSSGGPRRVRLAVARIDPWSVMKLSFLLSVAVGIMIVVAAAVTWYTLDGLAVFTSVNDIIATLSGSTTFFNILDYVGFERVISLATMIAVVDIVLLTALSTIGAFLYNIVAALVGGVHLTLTDD